MICRFFLVAFIIFSLYLVFVRLISMCLAVFLGLFCMEFSVLPQFECFLSHIRGIFYYNLFKCFLWPLSLSSSSGMPMMGMLVRLMSSQSSLRLSSVLFIPFSLFLFFFFFVAVISTTVFHNTYSLICCSASINLLLVPSRVFLHFRYCAIHLAL